MVIVKWAAVLGLLYIAVGTGTPFLSAETLDLETSDPRGGALQTSLWVVDVGGDVFVRATDPEALWLGRLRSQPDVRVLRDGVRSPRRALIVEGVDEKVDHAMREKYGRADEALAWLRDPADFVVIRLDPVRDADRWAEHYP